MFCLLCVCVCVCVCCGGVCLFVASGCASSSSCLFPSMFCGAYALVFWYLWLMFTCFVCCLWACPQFMCFFFVVEFSLVELPCLTSLVLSLFLGSVVGMLLSFLCCVAVSPLSCSCAFNDHPQPMFLVAF